MVEDVKIENCGRMRRRVRRMNKGKMACGDDIFADIACVAPLE
jgi:hypothetical protein